jgi:hypothetical protein
MPDAVKGPVSTGKTKWVAPDEPRRWQVIFKSGQGQQFTAISAKAARKLAADHYGEDYEIESVEAVE